MPKFKYRSPAMPNPSTTKWKIYKTIARSPISYSHLLKQKRKFQQSLAKFKADNFEERQIHSCSFITSNGNKITKGRNLNIVLFDEYADREILSTKLFVPEQTVMKHYPMLISLDSKAKLMIDVSQPNVYIQCENAAKWYVFYCMYGVFLERFSENVIGVQFYVTLVCHSLIKNEKDLLLCQSEELESVCALKDVFPLLEKDKPGPFAFDKHENIILKSINKPSNLPTQITKQFPKTKSSKSIVATQFKMYKLTVEKSMKSNCKFQKSNWKILRNFSKVSINSYTEFLNAQDVFDSSDVDFEDEGISLDKRHELSMLESDMIEIFTHPVSSMQNNMLDPGENQDVEKVDFPDRSPINQSSLNSFMSIKNIASLSDQSPNQNEIVSLTKSSSEHTENVCRDIAFSKPEGFNTLVAKSNLKVSFQPVASDGEICHKKTQSLDNTLTKSKDFDTFKTDNILSSDKNLPTVSFQTASGNSLKISETAIYAAMKIFEEVCSQVTTQSSFENNSGFKRRSKDVSEQESNFIREDVNALPNEFFDEISFDDMDTECSQNISSNRLSLSQSVKSNTQVKLSKKRKSLGGRRILKPYSSKS